MKKYFNHVKKYFVSDGHLSEGDLPGPLCVAGHVAAHDPALPHELAAADLTVVRVGVEGVEGAGAALGGAHVVVVQRHVDLGRVLADVVSEQKDFYVLETGHIIKIRAMGNIFQCGEI